MTYCMQRCFISLVWPRRANANSPPMACMHIQWGGDHDPCYACTKMGMVTGGSVNMEIAAVSSLHDMLHTTVFQTVGIATYCKGEHF